MDIELIKNHVYAVGSDDDSLLTHYEQAAQQAISNYLHFPYDDTNTAHRQAALLLIGTWYQSRESVVIGAQVNVLPHGLEFMLDSEMMPAI